MLAPTFNKRATNLKQSGNNSLKKKTVLTYNRNSKANDHNCTNVVSVSSTNRLQSYLAYEKTNTSIHFGSEWLSSATCISHAKNFLPLIPRIFLWALITQKHQLHEQYGFFSRVESIFLSFGNTRTYHTAHDCCKKKRQVRWVVRRNASLVHHLLKMRLLEFFKKRRLCLLFKSEGLWICRYWIWCWSKTWTQFQKCV